MSVGNLDIGVSATTADARQQINMLRADLNGLNATTANLNNTKAQMAHHMSRVTLSSADVTQALAAQHNQVGLLEGSFNKLSFQLIATAGAMTTLAGIKARMDSLQSETHKADALGMSHESLVALHESADSVGVSTAAVDAHLLRMERSLAGAEEMSSKAAQALTALNLSQSELAVMSPDQQFLAIADALSGVADQGQRAKLQADIFGKGSGVLAMLDDARGKFEENKLMADLLGTSLSNLQQQRLDGLQNSFSVAGESIKGATTQVILALTPALHLAATAVTGLFGGISMFFGAIESVGSRALDWIRGISTEERAAMEVAEEAARAREAAAERAARAAEAQQAAEQKITDEYVKQMQSIKDREDSARHGEANVQFKKDTEQFGRGRARELAEARVQAKDAETEAATTQHIADLRKELEQSEMSSLERKRQDALQMAHTRDQQEEINRLYDELARIEEQRAVAKEKSRQQQEAERQYADELKRVQDLERENELAHLSKVEQERAKAMGGINDTELRARAGRAFDRRAFREERENMFDLRDQTMNRQNAGIVDARSAEGFAALRSSVNSNQQEKMVQLSTQMLAELERIASGIEDGGDDEPYSMDS